ncbi:translocation/assembly module TamB domain-containing protein [Fulvivirga imtechensis]|uniref:translocation/assembly module TamB domain-containing protein n=1 Tax=Fulvivirga imtechensis TaxID=881893 RepID=UPI0006862D38|nr:translocation/assembly module TamB domain-containing protein [Fulvivirga imtechensis]
MAQVIKKRIVKAILWFLLSIFLLLAIVIGAIQVPYIQTKLVNYASKHYSELTGYDISIQRIAIDWFDEINVQGLSVVDPENNRLLYAEDVLIDFRVKAVLDKANHNIDAVTIEGADIFLTKITIDDSATTLNINELIRRIKAQIRQQTQSSQYLSVDHVTLKNSSFTYYDQERDSIKTGFDYHHFKLVNINGEFGGLSSIADTLDLEVLDLTANETSTHLDIKHMTSSFRVSQSAMEFRGLDIKAGNSTIKDTIIFKYSSTLDLSDFNSKVTIDAHLDNTRLHSKDLGLFAPVLSRFDEYYQVSGDFTGKVSSLSINNAHLKFGEGTALRGKIRMTGLPDLEETFINFDLTNSYVRTTDLKNYLKEKTYVRLKPFGQISFNAEFLGFFNDFVANGDFFTDYGRIISDINLKLEEDVTKSTYNGKLYMQNFDMGGYTENANLGRVSMRGEIKGSGVTLEDADFELKGYIDKIGIKDYEYTDIQTDAHFAKEYFEGFININDPNLKLTATGSIDLRKDVNLFNIKADLDTALLKPLNLSGEDIFLSSEIDINARGLKVDSIVGIANLSNSLIRYRDNTLQIDSLSMTSRKKSGERQLLLETNLLNFKAEGEFDYTVVYKDLKRLLYEYRLNLQNDKEALTSYYKQKDATNYANYSLDYTIDVKDPNPLFELIAPDLFISQGSTISGNLTGGYTSIISMDTHLDTVFFKNDSFYNNELQLNISKIADSTSVLAMVYLASENQTIANVETRDMMLEGIWNNMHIDFEFDIDQVRYANYARLFGAIDFLPDQTLIRLQPSDLQILDKKWEIQKDNLITIDGKEITVEDLKVYNEHQSISLNGQISEDTENALILNIDSLKLENLNTIFNKELSGTINGFANLSNYYQTPHVQSNLSVMKFKIEEFLIGDVKGTNTWNNNKKQFELNFIVERLKSKILQIKGTYTPDKGPDQLNLTAHLDKTELKILEPFIEHYFTKIEGTASGALAITGSPGEPVIRGDGFIEEGAVHINYLKTNYKVNGAFFFEENKLGFNNIKVTDSQGNTSAMAGVVTHQNFKDFYIDISGYLDNFLVLNTTSSDNSLFYGTGIATGSIHFLGPVNNMNIIANAKTEKGTRIFIPIGDSESIEQEDYINFIDFKDTTDAVNINEVSRVDLRGLKLDFDLNITPDAYCEIIFDIKSGDIIRGRGNGDIKLQIDTKGDFNMFGDFNIQEGGYNFTLYSIINKEFEILPGSKISWYGDPYQGILDINATYNQLATLLPLLIRQEADKVYEDVVEIKRKYPVKVFLDIDGPLLSPTVNFDIIANNLPRNIEVAERPTVDLEFEFLKFKNSIDEQELKRQVFSLIVLRRFSPLQSFNTGGSLTSSVSELLSNQLSYWITQVDENLEIDFDVDFDKLDEEAYNTFQLRLSYTFLDGRLRVTRDGGFTNQENRTDISSVAGDWTLEYVLTPDGKFRAKMYNRTNYNPINPTRENQNTITTGFSITHTQSFNELRDLFKKRKREKEEMEESQSDPEQDPDKDLPGDTQGKATLKDEEDETD